MVNNISTNWKQFQIKDLGTFYGGLTGKSKNDFGRGTSHYITFLNVLKNAIIDTTILERISVAEGEHQNKVAKGDLFFNTSSETPEEVGMCAVLEKDLEDTYLNSFCFGLRITNPDVYPLFLSHYFNSSEGRKIMQVLAQGATRYNLPKSNFSEVVINLPSKQEQINIATALSDIDTLIENLEKLIAKKKAIKQGAMQELLTGKRRLPGFDGEWKTATWRDVLDCFSSGATPYRGVPSYFEGDTPWVTSGELNYNTIRDTWEHISCEAKEKTSLTMHPPGTFLMAITGLEAAGTRGSCALLGITATTNQSCMAIYGTSKMSTKFLFHYYSFFGDDLAFKYCQGTKQQSYTAAIVKTLPITYPVDLAEQEEIFAVLDDMDAEILLLKNKYEKAIKIKSGMMSELLTGRIRLV